MSDDGDKVAKQTGGRRQDRSKDDHLSPQQQRALDKLRAEAKDNGATLATGGKGGLDPQRVLGYFRKDKYRCKKCGGKDMLTVHHVGGIVTSVRTSKLGHRNVDRNFVILCEGCHDQLHQDARKKGIDSSQVLPEGDKGTDRDHGQPDAHPKH